MSRRFSPWIAAFLVSAVAVPLTLACSSSDSGSSGGEGAGASVGGSGLGGGGAGNTGGQGGTDGGYGGNITVGEEGTFYCGEVLCQCSDGIDNNEDGLIDGFDPYCVAPWDNDELSFETGVPGDNQDPFWQDCFFDGNSGAGDDKCRYHTECITGERSSTDSSCKLTQACIDFCGQLTPNGCDCFGCCEVTAGGNTHYLYIGADCSLDDIGNCTTCTPSTQCMNTCGECELCLGKTVDDLPEHCGQTHTCEGGEPVCDTNSDCGSNAYCQSGCCLPVVR